MFARSERKGEVLVFIKNYMKEHGYAPSYREIGDGTNLKSSSSVHYYIQQLMYEGRLETDLDRVYPRAYRIGKNA